jgi:hypothetical protein
MHKTCVRMVKYMKQYSGLNCLVRRSLNYVMRNKIFVFGTECVKSKVVALLN